MGDVCVAVGLVLVLGGCGAGGDAARTGEESATATQRATVSAETSPAAAAISSPAGSPPPDEPAPQVVAGPPVPPTPGGVTAPFRSVGAEVGPIVWATAVDPETKAPLTAVASFPVETVVLYAAVPIERLEPGTAVEADWSYNGSPLDVPRTAVPVDRAVRGTWLEFHLARRGDAPWPDGIYAVRVLIDGGPAVEAAIAVGAVPAAG